MTGHTIIFTHYIYSGNDSDSLTAIPAIVRMRKVTCGKIAVADEDKAATHVSPHNQFLMVSDREL